MSNDNWVYPSYDEPQPEQPKFNVPDNYTEDSFKIPDFVNEYSGPEAALIGAGKGMLDVGRGVENSALWLAEKLGSDAAAKKRAELKARIAEEKKLYEQGIANDLSPVSGYANAGQFAGELIPSLALPGATAKTVLGRAVQNAGLGAGYEMLTSTEDNLQHGVEGGVGAGVGSAVIDTAGKYLAGRSGKYVDPVKRTVQQKLRNMGLMPQIGDIAPKTESSWIRAAEDAYARIPTGRERLEKEAEKLRDIIVPDKYKGTNMVTKDIVETGKNLKDVSNQIWEPFEQEITGNVSKVVPRGLHSGLQEILNKYPQTLSQTAIPDKSLRMKLLAIAKSDPKKLQSIPIEEYHDLRKSVGRALAGVKVMATPSAAGSNARLDKNAVGLFKNLYKESSDDIARWGNNGKNQKAFRLFEQANKEWEEKVLPWRQNTVVKDLEDIGDKFGANDTARRLAKETDTDAIEELRRFVKQHGPANSIDNIDAILAERRAANMLASHAGEVQPDMPMYGPELSPLTYGYGYSVGALSDKPWFQDLYFGDSSWARPKGGLAAVNLLRNIPIQSARQFGQPISAATYGIMDTINPWGGDDDSDTRESHTPISSANQEGVAGR